MIHSRHLNRLEKTRDTNLIRGENHEHSDQGNRGTARLGPEPVARQHHARPADQRQTSPLHSRVFDYGLTSNPTIFYHAIKNSHDDDDAIRQKLKAGKSGEALFFELALEDLRQAKSFVKSWNELLECIEFKRETLRYSV